MGVQLKLKEDTISFRRKQSHELKSLLRSLNKETENAVEIIVSLMQSPDEKMRLAAATKLLDMHKEVSVIINTDDIQRMLLESKNPDRNRTLIEDDTPMVDFETVQDV